MSDWEEDKAALRVSVLRQLTAPLSVLSGPPPAKGLDGVVVVVEDDPLLCEQAKNWLWGYDPRINPGFVGAELQDVPRGSLCVAGSGLSDREKVYAVLRAASEGKTGSDVLLLTPAFRAAWYGALFARLARDLRADCRGYAMSVPTAVMTGEADVLNQARVIVGEAQRLIDAIAAEEIDAVPGFERGGAYYESLWAYGRP